jgi:uncharacterized protein (TIGR02996 family)
MTDDQGLFQAILDNPDDDSLRLIYADYLDEHGEPQRADFIRVQIELAHLPANDPRWGGLETKERALLTEHDRTWVKPMRQLLPAMMKSWVFRRGFVEEFTVEARGLVLQAENLFRLAPLRALQVYLTWGHVEALAALPQLSRLDVLRLNGNSLGDAGARALAFSPYLGRLVFFQLGYNDIGDDGVQALLNRLRLPRLARLDLTANKIGDAGALALLEHLPDLEFLELSFNPISRPTRRTLRERFGHRVKFLDH